MQTLHAQPFSLEFLRSLGAGALDVAAIPGLSGIVLRGLELCLNHPFYAEVRLLNGPDLFAASAAAREPLIPALATPTGAQLDFYFAGCARPRVVELKTPRTLLLESAADAPVVQQWLAHSQRMAWVGGSQTAGLNGPAGSEAPALQPIQIQASPTEAMQPAPPPAPDPLNCGLTPPMWSAICRSLDQIHQEIAGVCHEVVELRSAKQRLEQMKAEGLFAFTCKVEPEAFKVFCTILAEGTVAKAGRALGIPDSTLRRMLQEWHHRSGPYKAMVDLVGWRKKVGRKQKLPLNEALFHEKPETTDYPGLLSDVLDGLLSMTEENWQERCEELAELLRPAVR